MSNIAVYITYPILIACTVNRNSLECADDDEDDDPSEDDDDNAVCATHGVTYPSLCRLLQDTGNEAVAYAGECDRDECQGGSVSGMIRRPGAKSCCSSS